MKRRDFLKYIPAGAALAGIPFAFGNTRASALFNLPMQHFMQPLANNNDNVLVMIFLEGGNDGLNTIVPFEDPLYDSNRPVIGFTTVDEKKSLTFRPRPDLGMNPQLNALGPLWDEGKLAMLQNVGYANPVLSHFRGADIWNSASDSLLNVPTGWAARYLELLYPDYPVIAPDDPLAISLGYYQSSAFFGSKGLVNIRIDDPRTYLADAAAQNVDVPATEGGIELSFVRNLMSLSNIYSKRFNDLFPKFAQSTVQYPDNPLAQDLQKIAWCIAAGLKTKVYYAHLKGFDTHGGQFSKDPTVWGHGQLLKYVGDALYAFQRDLEGLHVDNRVTTITYSEFGRRVAGLGDAGSGTDHGTAAPQFLLGSNIAGNIYGKTPDLKNLDGGGNLNYEFEFRQMYAAILNEWFGADPDTISSLLNPSAVAIPFKTKFQINGSSTEQSLFRQSAFGVSSSSAKGISVTLAPNPCQNQTTIHFLLDSPSHIHLELIDENGRVLKEILDSTVDAGMQTIPVMMLGVPSGEYYIQMQTDDKMYTEKLICTK